jgi:hypothetical protein
VAGGAGAASPPAGTAGRQNKQANAGKLTIRRVRRRLTLALALALLLIGAAGAESAALLQRALRIPTAEDIAQRVCTAFQQRDYDLLLDQIDPAPVPPAVPGPFDPNARSALASQLKALDAQAGAVTTCQYTELAANGQGRQQGPAQLQFIFSMKRAHGAVYTAPMTLVQQTDGGWKVSRASSFTGAAAPAR